MRITCEVATSLLLVVLIGAWTGCRSSTEPPPANRTDGSAEGKEPFVLGDLIEPFDPPTLEDLEAEVEWVEKPVLNSEVLMRERQAGETPLATVAEALKLANVTKEDNERIKSAMGRLAPADGSTADYEAEWLRYTAGDVRNTNPLLISSTAEFDVVGLIGAGLFGFDWDFKPFASVASVVSWHSSSDGMYDKVVMRDDMTWSDGTPITAHDVEFSFKVILSSQVPVPAMRSGTDQLKWVRAYDDHTVVFFHKESLATNIWNINFSIIPKHIYEESIFVDPTLQTSDYHVQRDETPVSGGAYTIVRRSRGQEIVLQRRETYYMHEGQQVRDKPYFKTIRFKVIQDPETALLALRKGDIEEIQLTPEQWMTRTDDDEFYRKNTKVYALEWVYFYFGWNCKTPYFSDKRVRKAMGYAFNHEEMMTKHRFGLDEASNGIFHRTSQYAPRPGPQPYTQDLDKAEDLLAEAGWEDTDGDGLLDKEFNGKQTPFEFTMLVSNRQDRIDLCNLLRENLDQIGIICNVRPMEFSVLQERNRTHKFQAVFAGWGTGTDPDTSENLWTTKAIDNGRNYVQYTNPEIDQLFEDGKRELDPEKRLLIYARIHEVLYEDQPYTWLFFRNAYFGFNKRLRGYNFSPRGPYNYGPGEGTIFKPVADVP